MKKVGGGIGEIVIIELFLMADDISPYKGGFCSADFDITVPLSRRFFLIHIISLIPVFDFRSFPPF